MIRTCFDVGRPPRSHLGDLPAGRSPNRMDGRLLLSNCGVSSPLSSQKDTHKSFSLFLVATCCNPAQVPAHLSGHCQLVEVPWQLVSAPGRRPLCRKEPAHDARNVGVVSPCAVQTGCCRFGTSGVKRGKNVVSLLQ